MRVAALCGAVAMAAAFAGCSSPLLTKIKDTVAKFPFTATKYAFAGQFGNPAPEYSFGSAVVKVDTAGFVYVADSTFRIRKFSPTGGLLKTYDLIASTGLSGSVYDMAFDPSGNMYVATNGTSRIQKYDLAGNLLLQWGTSAEVGTVVALAADSSGNVYALSSSMLLVFKFGSGGVAGTPASWGGAGADNNASGSAFTSPRGIAADANGLVYVTDGNVVKKYYASTGNWYNSPWSIAFSGPKGISADASSSPAFYIADTGNNRVVKTSNGSSYSSWGSLGIGDGQFTNLSSVAVDASGNVYAADIPYASSLANGKGRIQKFNSSGTFIASWGGLPMTADGQLAGPAGVAVDAAGNVYVSDTDNHRIQKFDALGSYLGQWGDATSYNPWYGSIAVDSAGRVYAPSRAISTPSPVPASVQVLDSSLNHLKNIGSGILSQPASVAFDRAGNIYVSDIGDSKVYVFDADGYTTHVPAVIGTPGTADGQMQYPAGVAVDSAGNVYVSDFAIFGQPHMIQKFDATGAFVAAWGAPGTGPGQLNLPLGINMDKYDNLYVCDFMNRRVEKFDSSGAYLGEWGGVGVGGGGFAWPFDVAIDASGKVFVADVTNDLVQIFDPRP
jgi:tripartite motif-containing protein 71